MKKRKTPSTENKTTTTSSFDDTPEPASSKKLKTKSSFSTPTTVKSTMSNHESEATMSTNAPSTPVDYRGYAYFKRAFGWLPLADAHDFDFPRNVYAKLLEIVTPQNKPVAQLLIPGRIMLDSEAGWAIDRLTGHGSSYFQFKLIVGPSVEKKLKMIYNMGLYSWKDLGSPDLSSIILRVKNATLHEKFYKSDNGFPCVYDGATATASYHGDKLNAEDIDNGDNVVVECTITNYKMPDGNKGYSFGLLAIYRMDSPMQDARAFEPQTPASQRRMKIR